MDITLWFWISFNYTAKYKDPSSSSCQNMVLTRCCYWYNSNVCINPSIFYVNRSKVNSCLHTDPKLYAEGVQGVWTLFWENYLWSVDSVCHLMMLYISIIFHEHILNAYKLLLRKQNYYCQTSKANNSKKIYRQKLHCLWSVHHPMMLYISVKFHEK